MPDSVLLREQVRRQIDKIKEIDILIGVPSYNNSRTIGNVISAIIAGVAKYFPEMKSTIVNSDGGSRDGTQDIISQVSVDPRTILISHRVNPLNRIVTPYHGIPGKGSAFRTIFQIAKELRAKVCAVVDSDLRSITPEWIELLIRPILKNGYDFVAPYYLRHKYDGTITNNIIYPLTRALYKKKIRQPIGGDFGFSGEMASYYLTKDVWETDVSRYGIDIWMTTIAITEGFKICQSFLGAKIHDSKDPSTDLSTMLKQVVDCLFFLMEEYYPVWSTNDKYEDVPIFGFQYEVGVEPLNPNVEKMIMNCQQGISDLLVIFKEFLPDDIIESLAYIKDLPCRDFHLSDELWAKIIYDFAVSYHNKIINPEHLLKSLTPLYLGKTASFILETKTISSNEAETKIERLCRTFAELKPYLIKRWTQ
ncbi:MAG: glycosyltransferase [Nitrospirota bacterium]